MTTQFNTARYSSSSDTKHRYAISTLSAAAAAAACALLCVDFVTLRMNGSTGRPLLEV